MSITRNVEKYQLSRTIGEGSFAKVKLAKNIINGQTVAIKVINKQMVHSNNLMSQVQREIRTMKLLNHPNIVRIHEVIGTKTKIYIVMEYVAGGQLSDKLSYNERINEEDARKYFQQLIDAVDYCHSRGVYHRDLKPENLLLDTRGNLKVSDFGLSALQKPGSVLLTTCGSPSYIAPELLKKRGYDGASADIWACGVILFEMLAGHLPFYDHNLLILYTKIWRAEYECPKWFTPSQKKLIGSLLHPIARKRIKVADIIKDEWFKKNYEPAAGIYIQENNNANEVRADFKSKKESSEDETKPETRGFINAFQLIAMSYDLNLSSLFEEDYNKNRIMLGSKKTITETVQKIETAARDTSLTVEKIHNSEVQMKLKSKIHSSFNLLAEVIEVSPTDCVVKVSKSVGESGIIYHEFCRRLSSLLTEESDEADVEA